MLSLHAAIEEHPHGYLLYFSFITTALAATLPDLSPSTDMIIQQAHKTVVAYLRILSKAGLAIIDVARSRRKIESATPADSVVSTQRSQTSSVPRPSTNPKRKLSSSHKSYAQKRKFKQAAHAAGLVDYHTKLIERNHTITEYLIPQQPLPPAQHPPSIIRREYGTTRPP